MKNELSDSQDQSKGLSDVVQKQDEFMTHQQQ